MAAAARAPRIDLDALEQQLAAEIAALAAVVEDLRRRRIRIGGLLAKIRPTWPARGPNAKGWGELLDRIGVDDSTARRYMDEYRDPEAFAQRERNTNVNGGSGETDRGAWITAEKWTERVGPWDLDPFSNPRSHVVSSVRCMLEDGGDGLADLELPGSWRSGSEQTGVADAQARVWGQPPYCIVEMAVAHYRHTRFCFLLRLDPSTAWFAALWERTQILAVPLGDREMFEPPPGVEASSNPQPHAFYYADPRDITRAIADTCVLLTRYDAAKVFRR